MDILRRILSKATERNLVKCLKVGIENLEVSHLQFVDETIFLENDNNSISNAPAILHVFEQIFGLKFNLGKTLLIGINVGDKSINHLMETIGCKKVA